MIEPFYLERSGIFICYHPPGNSESQRLVVICPPLFDEYRRSYSALADLANALAQEGLHVLRFDFEGTGDSAGNFQDVSADKWLDNITSVIEEGIALTGCENVSLVGIRMGATLAANCRHPAIESYVLWDPFPSGKSFFEHLELVNREIKNEHRQLARYTGYPFENGLTYEYFTFPQALKSSLAMLDCSEHFCSQLPNCVVLSTLENSPFTCAEQTGYIYEWPYYHNGLLMPKPVLERIARNIVNND